MRAMLKSQAVTLDLISYILAFTYIENISLRAKSLQLCPTLFDPMDCSPPGSSVRGFLQARIPEWVAISSFRGSSRFRDQTRISWIGRWIFYHKYSNFTDFYYQWHPTPVLWPGKSHGWRSLVGCSPWGR